MHRTSWSVLVSTVLFLAPAFAQGVQPAVDTKKLRGQAQAAIQSGDFESAAAGFKKVIELDPKDGLAWQLLGFALHSSGKLDEALPVHKKATEFPAVAPVAAYNVACVYALQGKTDDAFTWLDKAVGFGFDRAEHIEGDSDMDSLRKDPRFAKVVVAAAAAAEKPGKVQVFAQTVERRCSRIAWFDRKGSPGQVAIDYSPVKWLPKYDDLVGKMIGKKWRFGSDFWTSLDTSVPLLLGGVTVPAGYYYLTIEQREPGEFQLALHDANEVKSKRIDAFQAERLQGGLEVKLNHGKGEKLAEQLHVAIKMDDGSLDHGTLFVHFGEHELSAPVVMQLGK